MSRSFALTSPIAFSIHSTPSTARHGTSPQELTPTSKIKAMMAAIEDDSDPGFPSQPDIKSRTALSSITGNIQRGYHHVNAKAGQAQKSEKEEEGIGEEDDDLSLFVPRGRLAARLNGGLNVRQESSPNRVRNESRDGDAYTRIRKRLLPEDGKERRTPSVTGGNDTLEQIAETQRAPLTPRQTSRDIRLAHSQSPLISRVGSQGSSPGLFITPTRKPEIANRSPETAHDDGSGSDSAVDPESTTRFLELVARKKAEREAKNIAEDEKRKEKMAKQRKFEDELSRDASSSVDMSDTDRAVDAKLTQQSRPTRKASKKALEEMNRETQRMSRNMQLAHQAKTKKKITKDDLFARFNFRLPAIPPAEVPPNLSSSTVASSAPASDLEDPQGQQSPPTSPIVPGDTDFPSLDRGASKEIVEPTGLRYEEDELPSVLDIMTQPKPKIDKGKGKAIDYGNAGNESVQIKPRKTAFTQPPVKVRLPKSLQRSKSVNLDSDSDLEVLSVKKPRSSKRDVFDRLQNGKVHDGRSLQTLRALAHLTSSDQQSTGRKAHMSMADMQTSLHRRARQQAAEERAAKIEDLKSRGIVVQTAEERQQDQVEVENLLEKARREGEEIMQKEKRATKKAKIANGEVGGLPGTSEEDEDYRDDQGGELQAQSSESEDEGEVSDAEDPEDPAEISADEGEEEEEEEEEGGISLEQGGMGKSMLLDDEASEDGDDEHEDIDTDDSMETHERSHNLVNHRARNRKLIIDEEDDEDSSEHDSQVVALAKSPVVEVPEFPAGLFNFGMEPMGMTQAFAATMADSQAHTYENDDEQDSLAMLDKVPDPDFPMFDVNDSLNIIEDSQMNQQGPETNMTDQINLDFSQSQVRYDALGDIQSQVAATQMSEIPDPTQDVGFGLSSPAPERFVSEPPSTVATVLLPGTVGDDSRVKKKRGRLHRRAVITEDSSDMDDIPNIDEFHSMSKDSPADAFDAMRKARKDAKAAAARDAFDKKKSEAKGMVEEQAQESEDEYAGLGGASDEESGEEDEDVKAMMDHGEVEVDERRLAQLYANKERVSDEKAVEKLYKDINSGMLRKKRGADFDLSDSDDDAEARRKRKQREFAKMRKALLADENVGKIAEDPKKSAFLHTIEDRENDDDLDFLDRPAEDSFRVEVATQEEPDSQSQQPTLPAPALSKRNRPLQESVPDKGNMRPPAAARRTPAPKKPATLAEIRESVSFLIEEPGSINIVQEPSSSASEDEENRHEVPQINPRRTPANPIIDRLSLKRAESTSTSTSRLAFHDPAANPSIGGFKVPSLLRRATTSQLHGNGADANGISTAAMTERAAGGGEKGDFVRRGGTKRSSINFAGREKEKKGVVEGVERRRREERERAARERRGSGLGMLGAGSFE